MEYLPLDLVEKILLLVEPDDIIHCCRLNKHWNVFASGYSVWKRISIEYDISVGKESFIKLQNTYKSWLPIYKRIASVRKLLRKFADANQLNLSLAEPAPISVLEGKDPNSSIGQLFMFYHLVTSGQYDHNCPLFGYSSVYRFECFHYLIPMDEAIEIANENHQFAGNENYQFAGFSYQHDSTSSFVIINDKVCFQAGHSIITFGSFIEFIENYCVDLIHGRYSIEKGKISSFPNFGTGTVQGDSFNGLSVHASSILLPSPAIHHAYRITIKHDKKHSTFISARLISRHWEITSFEERIEIVDGPGVIGLYPRFGPSEPDSFSYVSQSPRSKSMQGHFIFLNQDGELFQVKVPKIEFQIPIPL